MTSNYSFPPGFVWGTATAAAQIEGATTEDNKSPSIWDTFAAKPGTTKDGLNPEVACDHYHLYKDDVALMAKLGIRHYRFSLAWTRLIPDGTGEINQAGFDYYNNLIDELIANDITPWCTFYHWDLPQVLEDKGGWRERSILDAFSSYAKIVVSTFGDRVKNWFTLNEIPGFIGHGYKLGLHAPGAKESSQVVNQAFHHAMVCHGIAVKTVRDLGGPDARVGLVHNPEIIVPFIETPEHIEAAKAVFAQINEHTLAPIYSGKYPDSYLERCGADAPRFTEEEMELISQPMDFLGLNVYRGHFVRVGADNKPEVLPLPKAFPRAEADWLNHVPQAMYWGLRFCHELYNPNEMLIAENGVGYHDAPGMPTTQEVIHGWTHPERDYDSEILDTHRCQYLRTYLQSVHRAIEEGIPLTGYFLWSLIDNFEWADGYTSRFGIVHTDFKTQRRTPKLSASWYSEVIRHNAVL
ncbi:GH1 family beta-glucosidase [Puniceicoccaceae bacterium K14]|nr:GH1 family beta-glucosidase [Puniceicoccaceae bacterium K14]